MNVRQYFRWFFRQFKGQPRQSIGNPDSRINDINRSSSPMMTIGTNSSLVANWRISSFTSNEEVLRGAGHGLGEDIEGKTGVGIRDYSPTSDPLSIAKSRQKEQRVRIVTGANGDLGWSCVVRGFKDGIRGFAGMRANKVLGMSGKLGSTKGKWLPLRLDQPKTWNVLLSSCTSVGATAIEVVNAAAYHVMDEHLATAQAKQLKGEMSDEDVLDLVLSFTQANTGLPMAIAEFVSKLPSIARVAWVDVGTTDTRGSTQVLTTKHEAEKAVLRILGGTGATCSYAAVQAGRVATSAKGLTAGAEIPVEDVVDVVDACLEFAHMYEYLRPEITILSSSTYKKISSDVLRQRFLAGTFKPRSKL